jgi:hypothetical protein
MNTPETAAKCVSEYLRNEDYSPLFVTADDSDDYKDLLDKLYFIKKIRVSDYCAQDDSEPDTDLLKDEIKESTEDIILLGLGHYSRISGNTNIINEVKDLSINKKVIVICRGVTKHLEYLCECDPKFSERRVTFMKPAPTSKIIKYADALSLPAISGLKAVLQNLEDDNDKVLYVKTQIKLQGISEINSAFDAVKMQFDNLDLAERALPAEAWEDILKDSKFDEYENLHWRTFVKYKLNPPTDIYLQKVVYTSDTFEKYKKRYFSAICDFLPGTDDYKAIYKARKDLLRDVTDGDISGFVGDILQYGSERIAYLTDNTKAERMDIIKALSKIDRLPENLSEIYPDLASYLRDYSFKSTELTGYFSDYKFCKVTNNITSAFYDTVLNYAKSGSRPYLYLPSRGSVFETIDKEYTYLYWLDALGVEYLGFIQSIAKSMELNLHIHIVRANLPSITSQNNDFFYNWNEENREKNRELDDLLHNENNVYNKLYPLHLSKQLQIIKSALDTTKAKLNSGKYKKVILASDHGASRLAVVYNKENIFEMTEKGEHSGRCCPVSDFDSTPEYADKENNFWVLANYDRFKGGRAAAVEVHGGASLEETIIPLIEVTLSSGKVEIKLLKHEYKADKKKPIRLEIFSKFTLNNMHISLEANDYEAEFVGDGKYYVCLNDFKTTGTYTADVYDGDNYIDRIEFEIQSAVAGTKKSNDEFFS